MHRKNRRMGVIEKSIIMYVNCHGRIIHINTPYISVDHNGTLSRTRQILGDEDFIQVNKSDLINIKYVIYTDFMSVTMWDGTVFPITPAFSARFYSKMYDLYIKR